MFPWALAIPAPIPFVFDFTLEFGSVLLLATLTLLSAVAVLRAALVANPRRPAGEDVVVRQTVVPWRSGRPEKHQAAPPSRAA